ncbi:MAG: M23 family metallopeptidase [Lachnospiraceae bacterium]|nr:M23 family metallopeptidase [Lachnospiraceae bacterium]
MEQTTETKQTAEEQPVVETQEAKNEQKPVEKNQKKYTAVLRSDDGNGNVKERNISWQQLKILGVTLCTLVVLTIGSIIYATTVTKAVKDENAELTLQMGQMSRQNSELTVENESLQEKVLLLSETVNQKVEAEAEAIEKAIPSGFPLAGITTILEEDNSQGAEEETAEAKEVGAAPEVIFEVAEGNSVIAAGSGVIVSIVEDETWGKVLKIDHENGYISVYKVDEEPKVKEGDEITKGTLLFEITDDNEQIRYQILQDEVYIDPLELMEISG